MISQSEGQPSRDTAPPVSNQLAQLVFNPARALPGLLSTYADEAIIRSAAIHGVGPLLALRMREHELAMSPGLTAWANQQLELNRQRQALLGEHLSQVLMSFQEAGIGVVPLKGAALLLRDEGGVAWRPMADLDILVTVPPQRTVDLALAHAGFCLSSSYNTGWSGLAWKHLEYQLCDHVWPRVDVVGEHPEHPRKLEAHFAVRELYRGLDWDLTDIVLGDLVHAGDTLIPSDYALALHLTVHAAFTVFERKLRISTLVDLQQWLTPSVVQNIADQVRTAGARRHARFVYPGLALLQRHAPDELLGRFVGALRPYTPQPLVDWIERSTLAELSYEAGHRTPWLLPSSYLATSARERAMLDASRWLPLPRDLSSAGYTPSSRRAILGWYRDYFRRQVGELVQGEHNP